MSPASVKRPWRSVLVWSPALFFLFAFALQYPLSSTFPMGGDAPSYIRFAQNLLRWPPSGETIRVALSSWYLGSDFVFTLTSALPLNWPQRFIWSAALAQIAVGLSLAWYLKKTFDRPTAIIGLAMWALTPIAATRHFEDGTIAQLFSYVFLLLFLSLLQSKKLLLAMLALLATAATHPATGIVSLLTFAIILMTLGLHFPRLRPDEKTIFWRGTSVIIIIIGLAISVLWQRRSIFMFFGTQPGDFSFGNLLDSPFAPFILLSPLGLILLYSLRLRRTVPIVVIQSFIIVSVILGFNSVIGLDIWNGRFAPYFIIALCLIVPLALQYIARHLFTSSKLQYLFLALFLAATAAGIWPHNARVYAFYESPSRYARLHPEELAAIDWLNANAAANSTVIATTVNRHSEWLSVLTPFKIDLLLETSSFFREAKLSKNVASSKTPVYIVFFLRREPVPQHIASDAHHYNLVYNTRGAKIYQLSNLP